MSFDEQPDGDIHGECAAEIHRLEQQNAELLAAAENLVRVKGRHHTEQAYKALEAAITKVKQP